MKIINIYDYRGRYSRSVVTSKPEAVYIMVNGTQYGVSDKGKSLKARYGLVEEAIDIISSHVMLTLITPMSRKHDVVKSSMMLKRTHLRNVIGFNMVNPNKLMWSVNLCKTRLDDMSYSDWNSIIGMMSSMDSNYVLVSCNNNTNWLKLVDVKASLAIVPNIDNMTLLESSRVGVIDMLYQERFSLIDFRHITSSDEKVNHVYNNNIN